MQKNLRHKATIRKGYWKDFRVEFASKNAQLAKIIDDLDPGSKYPLFEVTYPFGAEILRDSVLQLPTQAGYTAPFTHSQFDFKLQEQLGYNSRSNPVTFVLEGSTELFFQIEGRIIPFTYGLITPGTLFGLARLVSRQVSHASAFLWGMTAGARSLGLLAKITHGKSHNRLVKTYALNQDMSRTFWDHWHEFRQLYQSENFGEFWGLKVIFFPKAWFQDQLWNDPAWLPFRCYGMDTFCELTNFQRNQYMYDMIFSLILGRGRLKINPFASSVAKHVAYMGLGVVPGFSPALNNVAGPIERLQEIYNDDYLLEYAPVMMCPKMFSMADSQSVYYSLAYPTSLEFGQKLRNLSSKVTDIWQIAYYLDKYAHALQTENFNVSDIPLSSLFEKVDFTCYHTDNKDYKIIQSSSEIPKDDPYLLSSKYCKGKAFPELNVFTRGCIRISHKKTFKIVNP